MTRIAMATTYRTVGVRMQRKRTVETKYLSMQVPVEIEEVDAERMKTVATVGNPNGTSDVFHASGGRFFRLVRDIENAGNPISSATIDDYLGGRTHRNSLPAFASLQLPENFRGQTTLANRLPASLADGVKEVISDDAAERIADVRRLASGLLLVNDELWCAVEEPVWTVIPGYGREAPVLAAGYPDKYRDAVTFRLDRVAEADSYVRQLAKAGRQKYELDAPRIELHGAPLRRDDRFEAARLLGSRLCATCLDGWLRLLPRQVIVEWGDLREEVARPAPSEGLTDSIVGRIGRIVSAIDALDLNRVGRKDRAAAWRDMRDVLLRWTEFEDGAIAAPSLDVDEEDALAEMTP